MSDVLEKSTATTPYFTHQRIGNPASVLVLEINRRHLKIAELTAPSLSADVEDHAAYWAAALGVSRYMAMKYAEIGMMLRRMPRLTRVLYESGAIPMGHLSMLAQHTRVVNDAAVEFVELDLISMVSPSRSGEALRGVRAMRNRVQRVIDECDPNARPRDIQASGMPAGSVAAGEATLEMPKELADVLALAGVELDGEVVDGEVGDGEVGDGKESDSEEGSGSGPNELARDQNELRRRVVDFFGDCASVREGMYVNDRPGADMVGITLELERAHSVEFLSVVDAVADKQQVNRIEALLSVVRGEADISVNLDLFRVLTPGENQAPAETPLWLAGAGWLGPLVSDQWLERVSSIRVLGDNDPKGYHPTDMQKSLVRARDGICRFPGCEVPAEKCDIDHVEPYCHDNPAAGGKTSVSNLQCLCRRHHNVKTAGLWSATMLADGTVEWHREQDEKYDGGDFETFVTTPEGPFASAVASQAGLAQPMIGTPTEGASVPRSRPSKIPFGRYTFEQQTVHKTATLKAHNEKRKQKELVLRDLIVDARKLADRVMPPPPF